MMRVKIGMLDTGTFSLLAKLSKFVAPMNAIEILERNGTINALRGRMSALHAHSSQAPYILLIALSFKPLPRFN